MELQNKEKERKELLSLIEAIHGEQVNFRTVYQEIVGIIKSCNDLAHINKIVTSNPSFKTLPEAVDKIREKCKIQKFDKNDLQLSIVLVQKVKELKNIVAQQIGK